MHRETQNSPSLTNQGKDISLSEIDWKELNREERGKLIAKTFKIEQINELLLKILCHNICVVIQEIAELGIKGEFTIEQKQSF